jgi:hypothetical protein
MHKDRRRARQKAVRELPKENGIREKSAGCFFPLAGDGYNFKLAACFK